MVNTSFLTNNIEALYALLGTLLGGTVVKVLDLIHAKQNRHTDDAETIRKELWEEVHKLRLEIHGLRNELDEWKRRYFALYGENVELRGSAYTEHEDT